MDIREFEQRTLAYAEAQKIVFPSYNIHIAIAWLDQRGYYFDDSTATWVDLRTEIEMWLKTWVIMYPGTFPYYEYLDRRQAYAQRYIPVSSIPTKMQRYFLMNIVRYMRLCASYQKFIPAESMQCANININYPLEAIWIFEDCAFPNIQVRNYGHVTFQIYRYVSEPKPGEWVEDDCFTLTGSGKDDTITFERAQDAANQYFHMLACTST